MVGNSSKLDITLNLDCEEALVVDARRKPSGERMMILVMFYNLEC